MEESKLKRFAKFSSIVCLLLIFINQAENVGDFWESNDFLDKMLYHAKDIPIQVLLGLTVSIPIFFALEKFKKVKGNEKNKS